MTAARILICLCASFLAGIASASFFNFSLFFIVSLLILSISLIGVFWGRTAPATLGFCLVFLILGILRFQSFESGILKARVQDFSGRKASVIGRIISEPDKRPTYTNLKVRIIEASVFDKNSSVPKDAGVLSGSVALAMAGNYPEFFYGDKIKLEGKLQLPEQIDSFNWPGYLAKEGVSWQISYPKIEFLGNEKSWQENIFFNILSFKKKIEEPIHKNISSKEASLLSGLLFGDLSLMSKEFKQKMSIAGLSHITAVSGMNVIILSGIIMSLLVALGLWRQQAFWWALLSLWVFVALVGFPASAVRAGIMASLLLWAQYLGRQNMAWRAMIFAAVIMLALNPLLLRYDVGFQLSFLAVCGLVFISPILKEYFKFIPDKKFFGLKEILSQTFSAQIITLPVLIYNFGCFSLVAPLANILVVPLLPLIMALGAVFIIVSMLCPFLGWLFSWPSSLLLFYCTAIVDFCSKLPFASLGLKLFWPWLLIFYALIFFWIFKWQKNHRFLETGYI